MADQFRGAPPGSTVTPTLLQPAGSFPNNPRLPLLVYHQSVRLSPDDPASAFETIFEANGWGHSWRNGIYRYHHYHSTAHEVLGCFAGAANVLFGGPDGVLEHLEPGDVVIIPAGIAHKNIESSGDFGVVGAYPRGQEWDMCYGEPGERPQVDERIAQVPLPERDPVFGSDGPLLQQWR